MVNNSGAIVVMKKNRRGIYPPLSDADKIQAVEIDDFDAVEFKKKTREFQKIFLK